MTLSICECVRVCKCACKWEINTTGKPMLASRSGRCGMLENLLAQTDPGSSLASATSSLGDPEEPLSCLLDHSF